MMFIKSVFFVLCFFVMTFLSAQTSLNLLIKYESKDAFKLEAKESDTVSLIKHLDNILFDLETEGYVSCKVEEKYWDKNNYCALITKGKQYKFNNITKNETLETFYSGLSISDALNPTNIKEQFNRVLTYCENNGYPFASIKFSNLTFVNDKLNAQANLVLNDYFVIDSISIKGETKTNRFIVYREIGIFPGDVYDESELKEIRNRLNNSSFLSFIRYSEVSFTKGKALLTVFVKDKSSNKFGGILGINSDENSGKVILSGDVDLNLNNALKVGEEFTLNWRKTRKNTQNFFLKSVFPYLFKSRFGINVELANIRRDTTFSNTFTKAGISYKFQNNQFVSFFVKNVASNSLFVSGLNTIPNFNTSKTLYYGMELDFKVLDYSLNPRKGYSFFTSVSSGRKTIAKADDIVSEEYDKIKNESTQYEVITVAQKFFPLFKRSTILLKGQLGQIFNNNIFENELYQLGGMKSLRGFNEQSVTASNYFIGTLEYRFLFDKNSAVFTFLDYGYYEKRLNSFSYDSPFGFGLGVNLMVNSGVFTISYALGSEQNNPILFKNSKVHFGFVSVF